MISADDASVRPLSAKLLERPTLLTRIRWTIEDHDDAYLVPYVTTELAPRFATAIDARQRRVVRAFGPAASGS